MSLYQACRNLNEEGNTLDTLECVASELEKSQGKVSADTKTWLMLLCGSLVFFMQAGFAMVRNFTVDGYKFVDLKLVDNLIHKLLFLSLFHVY